MCCVQLLWRVSKAHALRRVGGQQVRPCEQHLVACTALSSSLLHTGAVTVPRTTQLSLQDVQRVSQMQETEEHRQAHCGVLTSEGLLQKTYLIHAFQMSGTSNGSPGMVLHQKLRDTLARKTPCSCDFHVRYCDLGLMEGLEGSPWHDQEHRCLEYRMAERGPSVEPGETSASKFVPLKYACIVSLPFLVTELGDRRIPNEYYF